jgi:hypothetical protein
MSCCKDVGSRILVARVTCLEPASSTSCSDGRSAEDNATSAYHTTAPAQCNHSAWAVGSPSLQRRMV